MNRRFSLLLLPLALLTALAVPAPARPAAGPFIVTPLETRVFGQTTWLRGGPASLRILVSDHNTGQAVSAQVGVSLVGPKGAARALFAGRTNGLGTVDAMFVAPKSKPGAYTLRVSVESNLGDDTVNQPLTLAESAQVLLASDKPLYQPGQTMHLRALALDSATRQPLGGAPVTFEVEDARGNKVFKSRRTLSRFGVASADFDLADEVNRGAFTLRAVTAAGQAEKTVRVERYVLPKFKVSLTTDKPYYLPRETVHGTLDAHYFFGKAVAGASVVLAVNTEDIGVTKLGEVSGVTDSDGKYVFEYTLPDSFVGQPFEQGKAVVEFAGTVKDTADQTQAANISLPVVKDPILLVIVPEHRGLVPGVENRVFLAAATPDGQPIPGLRLSAWASPPNDGQNQLQQRPGGIAFLTTDGLGLTSFAFTPSSPTITVSVTADGHGDRPALASVTLQDAPSEDALILRSDKTLAKVGDTLNLAAVSSAQGGTLYLDMIRDKQTILTRAVEMKAGQATLTLPVTDDMTGTIELHAYKILPNEDIIRDTRTVIVSPADDLRVSVAADRTEYKPGGEATLRFTVSDPSGNPTQAALGLAMVDESVFALSELKPGLEKVYFTLEKELMEPKYEIHGLTPEGLLLLGADRGGRGDKSLSLNGRPSDEKTAPGGRPAPPGGRLSSERDSSPRSPSPRPDPDGARQRAAAMLLADAPASDGFDWRVNTYSQRVEKARTAAQVEMTKALVQINAALAKYRSVEKVSLTEPQSLTHLVARGYLKPSALTDPWGHWYRANLYGQRTYDGYFTLSSAGPDGIWGTSDDIQSQPPFNQFAIRRGGFAEHGVFFARAAGAMEAMPMSVDAPMAKAAPAPMDRDSLSSVVGAMPTGVARIFALQSDNSLLVEAAPAPRVRSYFPETMYWNPSLITDDAGHAEVRVPLADSITTWRLSLLASGLNGQLGSATAPVKVFQDFFVDMDLPITLTQHDSVQIPVTVYNYLPHAQDVTLTLDPQPWFTLQGPSAQTLSIGPGEVKVVYYPITVVSLGRFPLTVTAKGSALSDAVRRVVEVRPDGRQVDTAINDRLEGDVEKTVTLPADALPGASKLFVKLYPGTFSQVLEGLDGLLQMPGGCFEQTSSTTYPDVLVLDYLKQTKKINPEVQMKAEGYIGVGYQRLVTFECKSGGFSWFGDEPAHQILTAYGLLEFSDMARVHNVDPALIARTQNWLAGKQLADGSWNETNQGIAEGIINRQTGALRTTAYVAWALAESGYQGPELARGVAYVQAHRREAKDPYTLAVLLNLLARVDKNGAATADVADTLIAQATQTDKIAYWPGEAGQTFTGAEGKGADWETTGLAAYGLLHWGRSAGFVEKVLTRLVQSKASDGTWGTTQGTVWSLKSLLYASRNAVGGAGGTVTLSVNGRPGPTWTLTEGDSDVMRQADLSKYLSPGPNTVRLEWAGQGAPLYQIATRCYLPWTPQAALAVRRTGDSGPLTIAIAYDKTTLAQNDTATVTATIKNVTDKTAEMPLIDLGIPPGFTPQTEALDAAVANHTISKYTLAARQIIVYLEKLGPGRTLTLTYGLLAKYPIHAQSPESRAYPYYNPERVSVSIPQEITVDK